MKKKLAALLHRWASKLSPDFAPSYQAIADAMICRTTADVKIFRAAHHYTRRDLQAMECSPDMALLIEMSARRELLHDIAEAMSQAGAITFHTEPEGCPDSHDVLIATCRAVVKK